MRIGYVAKHDSGGNDEEGAITFALQALGHKVSRLREIKGHKATELECDFVLFHHWYDPDTIAKLTVPKVFWNFDLVTYPDPTLEERNAKRVRWMNDVVPLVDVGFCTDGDWVASDESGKLVWLPQAADERIVGRGEMVYPNLPPILFTGMTKGCGQGREEFLRHLQTKWNDKYINLTRGTHGQTLANYVASTQVCVAPHHPATDRYWSNRVYLTAGFGGCLVHPYCEGLTKQYDSPFQVVMYRDFGEFDYKLNLLLGNKQLRSDIGYDALERTKREHMYRHRCEKLVQVVIERCSL